MAPLLLEALREHGHEDRTDKVFVQCFDPSEIERLRDELDCRYPLIQLIGDNLWQEAATDYDELRTPEGLARIARVADGIGPWLQHAYMIEPIDGVPVSTGLVAEARALGLTIHPYTFRADDLPPGFSSFPELVRYFVEDLRVDGLFTDFPDRVMELSFS